MAASARYDSPLDAISPPAAPGFTKDAKLELSNYGAHSFKGAVADKYLKKHGESAALLTATPCTWTKDKAKADIVAAAIMDWAKDNGASVFCHWCAAR